MLEASPTIPQAPHTGCHQSQLPLSCNAATLWSAARSLSSVRQPTIHYIQPNKQNNSIQFRMIPLVVLKHSSSTLAIFPLYSDVPRMVYMVYGKNKRISISLWSFIQCAQYVARFVQFRLITPSILNMLFHVCHQLACPNGCIATLVAFIWFFAAVCFQMCPQSVCSRGCIITLVTFV